MQEILLLPAITSTGTTCHAPMPKGSEVSMIADNFSFYIDALCVEADAMTSMHARSCQ